MPETIDQGNQGDILAQLEQKLRRDVPHFTETNCFISDYQIPEGEIVGDPDVICTIMQDDGSFPEPFGAGGGLETLCEETSVTVTWMRRYELDQPGRLAIALADARRGLISALKPKVLRAVLTDEDQSGNRIPWEPQTAGEKILRDQIMPTRSRGPWRISERGSFVGMALTFSTTFDWRF